MNFIKLGFIFYFLFIILFVILSIVVVDGEEKSCQKDRALNVIKSISKKVFFFTLSLYIEILE